MNIKDKLIEQLAVLEGIQAEALRSAHYQVAANISDSILIYIDRIEEYEDEEFICEECLEAELHKQMVDEIAKASDLPIELVNRVLDGMEEVLDREVPEIRMVCPTCYLDSDNCQGGHV